MTMTDQGEAVLAHAVAAYEKALGPRLVACYALGSLAHGGFSPLVRDVDPGLVLKDPLPAPDPLTTPRGGGAPRAGGPPLHAPPLVVLGAPPTPPRPAP